MKLKQSTGKIMVLGQEPVHVELDQEQLQTRDLAVGQGLQRQAKVKKDSNFSICVLCNSIFITTLIINKRFIN